MPAYKDKAKGTWYASFYYEDWTGKKVKKMKRGFPTKREALEWERTFLQQQTADLEMTFENFVAVYVADMKGRIKENTWGTKEHMGLSLWGYEVRQGTVLYLALEDDHRRLQERLYRMFGVESTGNLFFAIGAKQLGGGLEEQLKGFVREHPDTRLIIIDTLQKVREEDGGKYSYANDYEVITRLKRFADISGVCLLVVHHTRKQQADDKFDMISGTNGLLGAADGGFLLQKERRTDNAATLDISGRDQQDQRLYLKRDEERLVWELERRETELRQEPPDPVLEAVAALVTAERPEWRGTATELVAALGLDMKPNALAMRLNVRAWRLSYEYHIRYESARTHAGRSIKLTLEEAQA